MSLNKKIILILVLLFSGFFVTKTQALAGASFSLSPSTGVCIPGGTFNLKIILNTDTPSSGATAKINYDPAVLEAQTLTNGTIFPIEIVNSINSATGKIRLDAGVNFANPSNFTGSGTFGTIKFKVLRVGSTSLSFDFTAGSTKDSNVAHAETHQDILTSTSGGSYTFTENNTDSSLDPSCATNAPTPTPTPTTPPGAPTPTPTTAPGVPTPTPTTAPGAPTPTPTTPPAGGGAAGGAPEGGILGPTVFVTLLSLFLIGAGLVL